MDGVGWVFKMKANGQQEAEDAEAHLANAIAMAKLLIHIITIIITTIIITIIIIITSITNIITTIITITIRKLKFTWPNRRSTLS